MPYNDTQTTLDYIEQQGYSLVLVTSGKLGSINHTLLSLEVCKQRNIKVISLIYNTYPSVDSVIEEETQKYLQHYLKRNFPQAAFETLNHVS